MNKLITALFCLSIVLINPWGIDRGAIWSQPKILAVELITITNLFLIFQNWKLLKFSNIWKLTALLWGLFLLIGLVTTVYSPLPMRSLLGHVTMKSGLLYWGLIALFTLSNALVLKLNPEIAIAQFQGLLIGGGILALSVFPQIVNWQVDYTATSGQLITNNILKSTIFQGHQPIGLYSHRGHAAFTLVAISLIALLAYQQKQIKIKQFFPYISILITALIFTQTRAGLIAFVIAAAYLLGKKHYKVIVIGAIACVLSVLVISTDRSIVGLPLIKQITSDRTMLWDLSSRRIQQRPLIGWGFDGFEIAFPYQLDGKIKQESAPTSKAHNLIIDSLLSVGIVNTAVYLTLIGFCLYLVQKSSFPIIGAVAIAYLIYTFTWYECAQFTHIFWWSLSFFDYEKIFIGSFISNQSSVKCNGTMASRARGWISATKATIFRKV